METSTMRGIIKPMPDYKQHNLVGVTITDEGREFLVDDAAAKAFEPTTRLEAVAASDFDDDRKAMARREISNTVRSGFADEPGKPLVMTAKAFAWVKERIGTAVIVEPIGGGGVEAAASLSAKEAELDTVRGELASTAQALAELADSKRQIAEAAAAKDQELEKLRTRLAELEAGRRK
jgi:hypothetical protein